MFGLHLPDHEIERLIEKVLTSRRIEQLARRVSEMLLEHFLLALQERDRKR